MSKAEPKRILLLASLDDYRKVVQLSLTMASDWEVISTATIQEGLAIAEASKPDAIILTGEFVDDELSIVLAHSSIDRILVIVLVEGRAADWHSLIQLGVSGVVPKLSNPLRLAKYIANTLHWTMPSQNN